MIVLSACRVDVDYSGTSYLCPDGVTCPPGYTCVQQMCVTNSVDAGPESDGGMQASCGHSSAIAEDFDGTVRWAGLQASDGASIAIAGGRAVFTLPASPSGRADATLFSHMRFDLRGDSVSVDMPQMVNTATEATVELILTATWSDYVEFLQVGGALHMNSWLDDAIDTQVSIPYDSTAHRWWRFREADGRLWWETSPNGIDWNPQHSVATPAYVARSNLSLSAYAQTGVSNPGELQVESVNGGGSPGQGWCPMPDYTDDFEDNDRGLDWTSWDSNCAVGIQGGQVRFAPEANTNADCGFSLATAWDLTGRTTHIEIPSVADGTDITTYFNITDYNGNRASFNLQNGLIGYWICNPACTQTQDTYSAADHRWVRFRDDGGELVFETSPDASAWTERARHTANFSLTQISITMGATTPTANAVPGVSLLDNFNVIP